MLRAIGTSSREMRAPYWQTHWDALVNVLVPGNHPMRCGHRWQQQPPCWPGSGPQKPAACWRSDGSWMTAHCTTCMIHRTGCAQHKCNMQHKACPLHSTQVFGQHQSGRSAERPGPLWQCLARPTSREHCYTEAATMWCQVQALTAGTGS